MKNTKHSNPHNQGVKMKKIQLPSGEWDYYEAKTFHGTENDESLFSYCFKRSQEGEQMTFRVCDFYEDLSWNDSTPFSCYRLVKKNHYPTRAKALAAIRRHFYAEEWEGNSGNWPGFAICPERDKEGNLKISNNGSPRFFISIDYDNTNWRAIDNPTN